MEAHFVGITAYTCNTRNAEIERGKFVLSILAMGKTSSFKVGHDKAAQAAVYMETDLVVEGKLSKSGNVILVSVGEVDGGANKLREAMSIIHFNILDRTNHDGIGIARIGVRKCLLEKQNTWAHIAHFTRLMSTLRVTGSMGMVCTLILK